MIIYGSSLSPFVRKVLAIAAEKRVAVTVVPAGLGRGDADFAEASPFGKIPAMRDPGADDGRDVTLADSSAIAWYLETKFPVPALIPAAPVARARAIWFDEFADTILFPVGAKIFFNRFVAPRLLARPGDMAVADRAAREELPPILDYLERVVPAAGYLVGDALSLADIAVASPFANLAHVGEEIDPARWPGAAAYVAAILARPAFAALIAEDRRTVAAMGGAVVGGVAA